MDETNVGQDTMLTKGRVFKMDNFNNAFSSFINIRSKLESLEVMLNLYESIKEYLQLLRADINESDTNTSSHRLLLKNIDLIDRYLQTILRILVIESVKTESIKKRSKHYITYLVNTNIYKIDYINPIAYKLCLSIIYD